MPISIFKSITNSEAITNIKDFNTIYSKADQLKTEWENQISEKESRINALKESLERYENGFNFVGLYQGFDDLSKEKIKERNHLLIWLIFSAIITVIPILAELFFIYTHLENINTVKEVLLISILPTISLVAISIYYFRVLLFNFKSVKSQLLQIDLRKTLCRFIQNYSTYSSEIKKQDADSLSKFESIIFSGIITNNDKLPSTYDGIEQIGNIIKSIKK